MRTIALVLTGLLLAGNAAAQTATYDLTVSVDATKTNGSPWDGVPGLGNSRVNLNAPPDVAVCIVQAEKKPQCIWREQGRRLLSVCQNSRVCTFESLALPAPPFGLLFVDIDARRHDLIDIVIMTGNATAAGEAEIELALGSAVATLTPALSDLAKERGLQKAKVIPLAECAGTSDCRLTQSQFRLQRRN